MATLTTMKIKGVTYDLPSAESISKTIPEIITLKDFYSGKMPFGLTFAQLAGRILNGYVRFRIYSISGSTTALFTPHSIMWEGTDVSTFVAYFNVGTSYVSMSSTASYKTSTSWYLQFCLV